MPLSAGGHALPFMSRRSEGLARIEAGSTPVPPDAAGLQAAERPGAHVGPDRRPGMPDLGRWRSALLHAAGRGKTCPASSGINKALLESGGAAISEMNCVRKHLSRIKGGVGFAACAPAKVVITLHHATCPAINLFIAGAPRCPDVRPAPRAMRSGPLLDRAAARAAAPQTGALAPAGRRLLCRSRGASDRYARSR